MNVYVRELSTALARLGHEVVAFTRRDDPVRPAVTRVEPGFTVCCLDAGPPRPLERDELPQWVDQFTAGVRRALREGPRPDAIHANYWLSGQAGHDLKHEFALPLITTFHTLENVKSSTFVGESPARAAAEDRIVGCSDAILASCDVEAEQIVRHYGASTDRVHVIPLGVEHAFFAPGHRPQARRALGLAAPTPLLLFAGRLQELKGVDLALETLIALRTRRRDVHLAIVGGPSGPSGRATLEQLRERVDGAGVIDDVTFVAPQPHELLSTWYRAADVTLVPSRAESFGLVALESSACGTPVVASRVGGLTTLVASEVNGLLVDERDPAVWARAVEWVLDDERATLLSTNAVLRARSYTWRAAAATVATLGATLRDAQLVTCP